MIRRTIVAAAMTLAAPLTASPPPPPPAWVMAAGEVLSSPSRDDVAMAGPLFAGDVSATLNGTVVAHGKAAWLAWRAQELGYQRRTLAISEGWSRMTRSGAS